LGTETPLFAASHPDVHPPWPPSSADAFIHSGALEEIDMDKMDRFLHHANLERFRKQLANTADEAQRRTLLELLNAEEAKDKPIADGTH
jgi:hypothetical protein